jgi:purine-cytosine permease-like protein
MADVLASPLAVSDPPPLGAPPDGGILQVEQRGVEYIPEDQRHASPWNLFWVFFGADLTLGVIVLGWLPIAFGLNFGSAVTSLFVGSLIGSVIFAPIVRFGPRTGTNGAISSGAHFGVRGRLIGSSLGLLSAVGFFALTIWTSGEGIIAGGAKLLGLPTTDLALGIGFAIITAATLAIAIYGHATVVATQKFMVPIVGLAMLLIAIGALGDFEATRPEGTAYLLGGFWPTWFLVAVAVAAAPLGWAPVGNDYSRYISRGHSDRLLSFCAGAGVFLGTIIPVVFGAFIAASFAPDAASFVQGMVDITPMGLVPFILVMALIGAGGQCAAALYSTGLDLSSIFPQLRRVPATLTVSSVGIALVYLGTFVWDATATVTAFLILLTVMVTPWIVINLIGFALRQGQYAPHDLHAFHRSTDRGRYWFTGGVNFRAAGAWVPAVIIGALFSTSSLFTGPWANALDGVDLSFVSSGVIGGVLYLLFLKVFPEDPRTRDIPLAVQRGELESA